MAITRVNHVWFLLFSLISILTISQSEDPDPNWDCLYEVSVKTGSVWFGGTDSIISLTVYDATSYGFRINDLVKWGEIARPDHKYFQRGNLDTFSGKGPCLEGPVCYMNLTSDGSGSLSAWYCDYVDVFTTWPNKARTQQNFTVEQWLATAVPPFQLTAIRNNCGKLVEIGDFSQSSSLAIEM